MQRSQASVDILMNGLLDIIPASKISYHTEVVNFIQELSGQVKTLTDERDILKKELKKLDKPKKG